MKGKDSEDIKSSHGLTAKQLMFCELFLIYRDGKKSATQAGFSAKTAEQAASRLLRNVKVKAYLNSKTEKVFNKLEITFERVMQEYARIGLSDIRQYFDENGSLRPLHELSDDAAAALSSIEVDELSEYVDGVKVNIGFTKKVKLWDKRGALDSICKIKGWNAPEEVKHTGKIRIGYGKEED
jgi:phage terminase small subunit